MTSIGNQFDKTQVFAAAKKMGDFYVAKLKDRQRLIAEREKSTYRRKYWFFGPMVEVKHSYGRQVGRFEAIMLSHYQTSADAAGSIMSLCDKVTTPYVILSNKEFSELRYYWPNSGEGSSAHTEAV